MKNKFSPKNKFSQKNKKGFTLVEAIVATLVLSIVVITLVSTVSLTRRAIMHNGVKDIAASKAQTTVELLMQALSQSAPLAIPDLEDLTNAFNSGDNTFSDYSKGDLQFFYDKSGNGYKIYGCAFYNNGKDKVILQGYASPNSGEFKPKEVTKP